MNKNIFAPTPPMGWNSYDYYDTTVNEAQVKANADYMAAHLKEYGWEYIIVDIQWYAHGAGTKRSQYQYIPYSELEIDSFSRLMPDPERFPSSVDGLGFRPLADYVPQPWPEIWYPHHARHPKNCSTGAYARDGNPGKRC